MHPFARATKGEHLPESVFDPVQDYIRHLQEEIEWLRTIAAPYLEKQAEPTFIPAPVSPELPDNPPADIDDFVEWIEAAVETGEMQREEANQIIELEKAADEHGF